MGQHERGSPSLVYGVCQLKQLDDVCLLGCIVQTGALSEAILLYF